MKWFIGCLLASMFLMMGCGECECEKNKMTYETTVNDDWYYGYIMSDPIEGQNSSMGLINSFDNYSGHHHSGVLFKERSNSVDLTKPVKFNIRTINTVYGVFSLAENIQQADAGSASLTPLPVNIHQDDFRDKHRSGVINTITAGWVIGPEGNTFEVALVEDTVSGKEYFMMGECVPNETIVYLNTNRSYKGIKGESEKTLPIIHSISPCHWHSYIRTDESLNYCDINSIFPADGDH